MKRAIILFVAILFLVSCTKNNIDEKVDITYKLLNKEYVIIRNVEALQQSDDEVSEYIDSILNGYINAEFISTGQKIFMLNDDNIADIGFEIIDLNLFNSNGLPESFDSLAARVMALNIEILDNSTYGYPDALKVDGKISNDGNWATGTGVLGTFMNAGQFQGNGERYLGFRFVEGDKYLYGWIKIYCSQHNDTLRIIDYAYNNIENSQILAGQKK